MQHIPSLAFSLARQRSTTMDKPPGKNWARAFEKIHPELKARRVRSMDWKRHENNTYVKIIYWFEETGIMLSMLGSVKVLVSKDDLRGYRGAGVKRTTVTTI